MTWMLKNSKGRPDAMLTASMLSLVVVLLKVLANGAIVGGHSFGTIDGGLVAAVLGPTFAAYWGRKHTESKVEAPPKAG